ncbi:hypothetical protein COL154_008222 [Colletotrichum chrysophilum]|nr:hypothetical protein COL154_008222 [Colletotrichum chrysophilum]
MFVRGPGLVAGGEVDSATSHTDIAPTILKIAGAERQLDGEAMPWAGEVAQTRNEHAAIEFWGWGAPEGHYGSRSDEHFESGKLEGERELFNLKDDPEQTVNLLSDTSQALILVENFEFSGRGASEVVHRLDAVIMALKDCEGRRCSRPWSALHPDGDIVSLEQALDTKYDDFYKAQPKMYFESCEAAFIKERESNEPVNQYGGDARPEYDYGDEWILAI